MAGVCAFGFDVNCAFSIFLFALFPGCVVVWIPAQSPPASETIVHHCTRQAARMASVHVFLGQMVHDFCGLGGREQGCAPPIAEKPEVAVVGDYVDGVVPCNLAGSVAAGADVIDSADVAAVKAEAGAVVEHVAVGRVGGR